MAEVYAATQEAKPTYNMNPIGTAPSFKPADEAAKMHQQTWGQELRTLEHQRRRTVDPELLKGPAIRVTQGLVRAQERVFDPLVQRYRDPEVEHYSRSREENVRTGHLNRAMDIQMLREQPWNILTNASRLEGIDDGIDPVSLTHTRPRHGRAKMPDTFVDYNVLSNLPMEEHHWAPPHERPVCVPNEPRNREIPAFMQKDYNIVNNRYLHDHEKQLARDKELNKLASTAKYRERNRFNPVSQQYTDGDENNRMRTWEEAHKIEAVEKAQCQVPPSIKNRPSAYWNIVNHRQANADTLKWQDLAEDERKERYKNRYIMENNLHSRDIKSDAVDNERRLNGVAHERFAEPLRRGYDIVTHDGFNGKGSKPPYLPYTGPQPDVWERAQRNRSRDVVAGGRAAETQKLAATEDLRSIRSNRSSGSRNLPKPLRSSRSDGGHSRQRDPYAQRAASDRTSRRSSSSHRPQQPQPPVPSLNFYAPPAPPSGGGANYSKPI